MTLFTRYAFTVYEWVTSGVERQGGQMTLYQLKIFEAVARHANITQASLALHASQPAVSQQLKLLQDEYGVRFLNRLSHGVELTPEGRVFLVAIKPVLAQIESIEKRFKVNHNGKESQSLLVGGSSSVSASRIHSSSSTPTVNGARN